MFKVIITINDKNKTKNIYFLFFGVYTIRAQRGGTNMETSEIDKTKKTLVTISKVAYVFAYIIMILCFMAAGFGFVGMIASAFLPYGDIISYISSHPELNVAASVLDKINISYAEVGCTFGVVYGGIAGVSSFFVKKLFHSIHKEGTPFTESAVKSLNMIGIFSLIQAIVVPGFFAILTNLTNTKIMNPSFLGTPVVFALFIFALSLVFKYGVVLQHEADATL